MTQTDTPADIEAQVGALAERLFAGAVGALEALTVHLGVELGLYETLYERGPSTARELAVAAGIHPRYAQEWLEQQATAEFIDVDDVAAPADERRFSVADATAAVFIDPTSLAYLAPAGKFIISFASVMPQLVHAYRTGGGVPYGDYGAEMRDGQGAFNRPAFHSLLADEWMAKSLADVHAKLHGAEHPQILDVACGIGWSTIAFAKAYPHATVIGVDLDGPSIESARVNAKEAGVDDRVTFLTVDAADEQFAKRFDLVFLFEALHDMSRPVDVLQALRAARADEGAVVVADERVADDFGAIGDFVERFMYGASVLHCLPAGMADQPSAATGTVMRIDTVRQYAHDAGFATLDVLPIEHDFFRFYRLGG